MTDPKKLRESAEKATPGKWRWWTSNSYRRLSSDATGRDGDVLHATVYRDGQPGIEGSEHDAAFIAACNPATVIALLDRLEAAEAVCAEAEHPAHCDEGVLPLDVTQAMAAKLSTWRRIRDGQGGGDGE